MAVEDEVSEALRNILDTNEKVRSQAVLSLGWLGDKNAIRPLIKVLASDASEKVRANAAMSLGQLGYNDAVMALISALNDKSAIVRGMSAYSLGLMREEKALEPLIDLLKRETNTEALIAVVDSLTEFGDEKAIEPLIELYAIEQNTNTKNEIRHSLEIICEKSGYEGLEEKIAEQVTLKEKEVNEKRQRIKEKVIAEMENKEQQAIRKMAIRKINNEFPRILEFALHDEKISLESLSSLFDCDLVALEIAIAKMLSEEKIIGRLESDDGYFLAQKPEGIISEDAQLKVKLLRKKFSIGWETLQ